MPEATVNEHDLLARWKYKVGGTRKPSSVQPEPIAQSVNQSSHKTFGLGICPPYACHVLLALLWCQDINHQMTGFRMSTPIRDRRT